MGPTQVRDFCQVDETVRQLLGAAMRQMNLSARAYHLVFKLARTIADPSLFSGQAWREVSGSSIERNPNLTRQEYALEVLAKAAAFVVLEPDVEKRARELNRLGFKPLDALHLASAEAGQADFLCTCDDRFLKRARASKGLRTKVVSPIELIGELERW